MKMTVKKENLIDALAYCSGAAGSKRNTLPVLECVKMSAKEGKLECVTTDLEITLGKSVECEVEKEGTILVLHRDLFGLVKEIDVEMISLEVEKKDTEEEKEKTGVLLLKTDKGKYRLPLAKVQDFPKIEKVEAKTSLEIDIKEVLQKTMFAVSNDEIRYALNGVFFDGENAVATNGIRLSVIPCSLIPCSLSETSCIVPTNACREIAKIDGKAEVQITDKNILFRNNGSYIKSRLVEGKFPDYKTIIPKNDCKIKINSEELVNVLKRMKLIDESAVEIAFGKDSVVFKNGKEGKTANEEMVIKNEEEKKFAINPVFLIEVLKRVSGEVVFELGEDANSPIVIKKDDFTHIIMPVKL
ncbi:DNA polymerase III subunit beta [bacterium]|nr:DNA polymerase III subunit beta [bacterium]